MTPIKSKMNKLKIGDRVLVVLGGYTGAKGTVSSVWGNVVSVDPNENADTRQFHYGELKKITEADFHNGKRKKLSN